MWFTKKALDQIRSKQNRCLPFSLAGSDPACTGQGQQAGGMPTHFPGGLPENLEPSWAASHPNWPAQPLFSSTHLPAGFWQRERWRPGLHGKGTPFPHPTASSSQHNKKPHTSPIRSCHWGEGEGEGMEPSCCVQRGERAFSVFSLRQAEGRAWPALQDRQAPTKASMPPRKGPLVYWGTMT